MFRKRTFKITLGATVRIHAWCEDEILGRIGFTGE